MELQAAIFAVALAKRNPVSPGWIEDSVLNRPPQAAQDAIRRWHTRDWTPMERLGTPADVGTVIALLYSEDQAG